MVKYAGLKFKLPKIDGKEIWVSGIDGELKHTSMDNMTHKIWIFPLKVIYKKLLRATVLLKFVLLNFLTDFFIASMVLLGQVSKILAICLFSI